MLITWYGSEEEMTVKRLLITPTGHYKYLVMPYGLVNALSVLQDFMHNALWDCIHKFVLVYIDDILICSEDPQKYHQHVAEVLNDYVNISSSS